MKIPPDRFISLSGVAFSFLKGNTVEGRLSILVSFGKSEKKNGMQFPKPRIAKPLFSPYNINKE
jgi:hypothetical protein